MKNISNLQRLELIHLPTPKYKVAYYQCDQIWRNFTSLGQCYKTLVFWKGPFTIWQFIELTLANFIWFWANVQCCKWPNIEPINSPSGHTASHCVTLCQWTYERLSKHGTSRSSMTWSSLFRLSMHIRSSWSGGPKRLPRPAVLFSQNSDSCSLRFFRALALAFQNNFLKTVSLSKSSWSPL